MFKVITWNVNSIKVRLERLLALLERESPDAVCLQELKCMTDKFPTDALKEVGYQSVAYGQKTYNGVAIISKHPIKDPRVGFDDEREEDSQARVIAATIKGVRVISVYVPNGKEVGCDKYDYKLGWFKRLRQYLDTHHTSTKSLVLCGDFNVAPEDRDVYDPKVWKGKILFSEPEKKALANIEDYGLQDTFRLHHQDSGFYSWWDYRQLGFQKNRGMRIDFVLASSELIKTCTDARIDRDERKGQQPSDHAPVIAEFKL